MKANKLRYCSIQGSLWFGLASKLAHRKEVWYMKYFNLLIKIKIRPLAWCNFYFLQWWIMILISTTFDEVKEASTLEEHVAYSLSHILINKESSLEYLHMGWGISLFSFGQWSGISLFFFVRWEIYW